MHPIAEVGEAQNFVRLCERLNDGGSHPNAKRRAGALGLHAQGNVPALRTRIELRLRELEFGGGFLGTHRRLPKAGVRYEAVIVVQAVAWWRASCASRCRFVFLFLYTTFVSLGAVVLVG